MVLGGKLHPLVGSEAYGEEGGRAVGVSSTRDWKPNGCVVNSSLSRGDGYLDAAAEQMQDRRPG